MRKTAIFMVLCIFISIFANGKITYADSTSSATNLKATINVSDVMSYIKLDWDTDTSATYYYRLQKKVGNDDYDDIGVYYTSAENSYTDVMSYPEMGISYSYRIAVYDSNYDFKGYSNVVSFVLKANTQPTNLIAEYQSDGKITLAWDFVNEAPLSTTIERKAEGTDDENNNKWEQIGGVNGNTHYFEDTNIEDGVQYTYRIRCILGSNCYSPYVTSNVVHSSLVKPSDFTVSLLDKNSALLEWSNIWTEDVEIIVEKKTNNGEYTVFDTLSNDECVKVDKTLVEGNSYTYRIRAHVTYSGTNTPYSAYSDEVTIMAIDIAAPSGLAVTATTSTTAELSWQDNSNNESGFEIWRSNGNGTAWEKYAVVLTNVKTYSDKNLTPSSEYHYKVRAFSNGANVASVFTSEVTVKTVVPTAKVVLDYSCANNTPTLKWNITGDLESECVLQLERRGEYDLTWSALSSFSTSTEDYTDTVLTPYTRYSYRMKVINTSNNSATYSDILEFAPGIPNSPTNIKLTALGSNIVKLDWNDNSMNEEGYVIERDTDGAGYIQITKVPAGQTSYIDSFLSSGKTYSYRVSSYNKSGESEYSDFKMFTSKSPSVFYDMSNSSWALDAVLNLADTGVIGGTSQGYFSPDENISRAEFTSMVIKALKLQAKNTIGFSDTKPSDWYYNDLATAKAYGIVSGTNGRFYPENPITREDMSVILCKALEAANMPLSGKDSSILDNYSDRSQVSDYTVSSISSLKAAGLINGKDGNRLAPKDYLSRAEAAEIIWRVIKK